MNRLMLIVLALILLISAVLMTGCTQQPTQTTTTPTSYKWQTATVLLEMNSVQVIIGDKTFSPISVLLIPDPGNASHTALEVKWYQDKIEMRISFSFTSDGSRWWADEIRTYDGQTPPNWINYSGKYFDQLLGVTYKGDFTLNGTTQGGLTASLIFTGLRLIAFK